MNNTTSSTLAKPSSKTTTKLLVLLSIATLAPLAHFQPVVGPTVNAALFISTAILGVNQGFLVALIPSPIALAIGLLPSALAPMIPFIIISNIILVATFNQLWKKNYWQAIIAASILKFLFLWFSSTFLLKYFTNSLIAKNRSLSMSWPQLFTALSGGMLAYIIIKILKQKIHSNTK